MSCSRVRNRPSAVGEQSANVAPNPDFPQLEQDVLRYWDTNGTPFVHIFEHGRTAGVVEFVDAHLLDLVDRVDAELLLRFEFGGQAVRVPAEHAVDGDTNGTFQKSIDENPSGEHSSNEFVFFDGPPFANAPRLPRARACTRDRLCSAVRADPVGSTGPGGAPPGCSSEGSPINSCSPEMARPSSRPVPQGTPRRMREGVRVERQA